MSDSKSSNDAVERKLEVLFAQLREAERQSAPDFPEAALLPLTDVAQISPMIGAARKELADSVIFDPPAPVRAAGALAAAILVALLIQPGAQSPDALYLEIMQANTLLTDDMLLASPVIAPEQSSFDDWYAEPGETEAAFYWN